MDPSSSSSSNKRKRDLDCYDEPCHKRPKYDVFVNYASQDIGKGFVSHLTAALRREGFTISDHNKIPNGLDKSSELLKAIEDSEIYLVVFSPKYASYKECLDEFALIMETYPKLKKRNVFPIFFDVDPSHVRNQQGSFLEAFQDYEKNVDPGRVQIWRQALKEAGDKSGLNLKDCRDEEKLIRKIMKYVRKMENPQQLCDVEHPVGIDSRAQDVISTLRLSSIVAVLGVSGSGKTTVVKAVYDKISADFDVSCFIQDINSYVYSGPNWKVDLQKDVVSCLTGKDKFVACHNDGAAKIKKLLSGQKLLLVLDDVYKFEQLQALSIPSASFHCESRIIVTTRNTQSLSNLQHTSYNIKLLDTRESFELFTRLIGKGDPMDKKFVDAIVECAGGIPLVLEVWSRHFTDYDRKLWPSMLKTLKRIPHEDTQKKLQISYDSLPKRAQNLFLDIACFFNGMNKDFVMKVLQDEDFFPDFEIQSLVHKFLVKNYSTTEIVSLHDVIRKMAQEVVRQEDEDEPGKRTRLMDYRDVVRVLGDCSGTDSVRSILLVEAIKKEATVELKAFKKMSNLRFIMLKLLNNNLQWSCSSNDDMSACFSFKNLKYLEWWYFPCKSLDNIDMGNVVVIKLILSELESLWEGANKCLKKLKILDVSLSWALTKTGSFIGLENLEELDMCMCENLEELDSSVCCLEKLVSLDLSYCENLVNLPESFGNLLKLKELYIEGCSELQLLPPLPSQLRKIEAAYCESLDVIPYDSMQKAYIFPSNPFKESRLMSNEGLEISLSGDELPEWCTYQNNSGNVSSFVAPIQFHHTKICGLILCATSDEGDYQEWVLVYPTIYNKTKGTSHSFGDSTLFYSSMLVMFYPLNDTTLVVEAGDTVQLEFFNEKGVKSVGLRLVYEDDVVDSGLVLKDVRKPTLSLSLLSDDDDNDDDLDPELVLKDVRKPATLSLFPLSSEIMTSNSIAELNDEEVCPFPVRDEEYAYYDFLPMVS